MVHVFFVFLFFLWCEKRSVAVSSPWDPLDIIFFNFCEKVFKDYFLQLLLFTFQPVPTSPTSTSPTPGGTLGMPKMDTPSMQDVYILSPVSGLYSTRSGIYDSDYWSSYWHCWQLMTVILPPPTGKNWVSCHVMTSAATVWVPSLALKVQRQSVTTWTRTVVSSSLCWREMYPLAQNMTGAATLGSAGATRPPPMVKGRVYSASVNGAVIAVFAL